MWTVGSGELYAATTYWSADAPSGVIDELHFNNSEALGADEIMAMYTELAIQNATVPSQSITDIMLPTTIGNAEVRWVSSDESVITSDGRVTRGSEDKTVTLSLYMGDELLATYEVTVLKNVERTNNDVVLSYIFDEKTEGVIEDASGNGNHGAIYGGMVGTHFDGADDYVEMPANILDGLDEFTIVMRIKAEIAAYDADQGIIRDKRTISVYNGVVAYATDGENIKITNTTDEDLDVMLISASYDENGVLTSVNSDTLNVSANFYEIMQSPVKDNEKLFIWFSYISMKPVTAQK